MSNRVAVLCGASRGIGAAILKDCIVSEEYSLIYAVSRSGFLSQECTDLAIKHKQTIYTVPCDIAIAEDVQRLCQILQEKTSLIHVLISTVGFLSNERYTPEKNIRSVSKEQLEYSFSQNTWPALCLAHHLQPLLHHKEYSRIVFFSARVGSIEDNHLGGWYSYRISKAALHMAMRTISIELGRRNPQLCCVCYHPGTVDTDLSRPFTKRYTQNAIFSPEEASAYFMNVLHSLTPESNGTVVDWKGERIPF